MKIFDTHAHYDDEAFEGDRDALFESMFDNHIETIINVGASKKGCEDSIEIAEGHESIYAAIGIHPEEVESLNQKDMEWLKINALSNQKVVAIGEIGLDYHYPEPEKEVQQRWFREQMRVAAEVKKPIIIHSRDAFADTLQCMKAEHAEQIGGVVHCYAYSKEAARDFLNMGFYFGIGGVLTFKNARKLVETVSFLPMDRILLETDCPYLAPEPNRGTRNNSENLLFVVKKIAEIKEMDEQEVIDITNYNARKLFLNEN